MKLANEPSSVATPMSIPFVCRITTTQDAAANMSVAASAIAPLHALRSGGDPLGSRRVHRSTTTVGREHVREQAQVVVCRQRVLVARTSDAPARAVSQSRKGAQSRGARDLVARPR